MTKVVRRTEIILKKNWGNIEDFVAFKYAQGMPSDEG